MIRFRPIKGAEDISEEDRRRLHRTQPKSVREIVDTREAEKVEEILAKYWKGNPEPFIVCIGNRAFFNLK